MIQGCSYRIPEHRIPDLDSQHWHQDFLSMYNFVKCKLKKLYRFLCLKGRIRFRSLEADLTGHGNGSATLMRSRKTKKIYCTGVPVPSSVDNIELFNK
jgi:hypothetical protein